MRGYNKVILMGNLTRDPELRYTVNRRAYARFTIAVGYSFKTPTGEFQEGADFIPIVAWGPLAETCGRYLRKGSGVFVEGRIKTGSYDAKDGSGKRYTTDVMADVIRFVGGRNDNAGGGNVGFDGGYPGGGYQQGNYQPGSYQQGGNYQSRGQYGGPRNQPPLPPAPPAGPGFNDTNFGQSIQDKGFGNDFPIDLANMPMQSPEEFRAAALADNQSMDFPDEPDNGPTPPGMNSQGGGAPDDESDIPF